MTAIGKVTLRNYRCFDWNNPAVLEFGHGFTAYIGPNNAGKSTALRAIYELRNNFLFVEATLNPANGFKFAIQRIGITDLAELFNDKAPDKFEMEIEVSIPPLTNTNNTNYYIASKIKLLFDFQTNTFSSTLVEAINHSGEKKFLSDDKIRKAEAKQGESHFSYRENVVIEYTHIFAFNKKLINSRYFPAFRNAINEGAGNYYDLPVGTALVQAWDSWKAGHTRANQLAAIKAEHEIARLLGFDSLEINADQENKTLNITINKRPHKLYEVGAGVAQLIITLTSALVSNPEYILIDEPELNLHPALQLNFLSTLASYAKEGLLFSTHSIGLARNCAQRIFSVHRAEGGSSSMSVFGGETPHFAEWLGELSFASRLEIGCDGLLLVEGSTDVLVFQEFLRKVNKDQKYVVFQLGGSSMIKAGIQQQISELFRIVDPSNIRIFIDSEKSSKDADILPDRLEFLRECESIGVRVTISERRATENYFEGNGIKKALGDKYGPIGPYEKLKDCSLPWHKSDNWKVARETAFEDIKNTDFWDFINSL